jgi:hypothetical protein
MFLDGGVRYSAFGQPVDIHDNPDYRLFPWPKLQPTLTYSDTILTVMWMMITANHTASFHSMECVVTVLPFCLQRTCDGADETAALEPV